MHFDSKISAKDFDETSSASSGAAPGLSGHSQDDAPTLSGLFQGDAPTLSGHSRELDAEALAAQVRDCGTSNLPKPTPEAQADCARRPRTMGCKTLLMELFPGSAIMTLIALSAGWQCG